MPRLVIELPPDKIKEGAAAVREAVGAITADFRILSKEVLKTERDLARSEKAVKRLASELDPGERKVQALARAEAILNRGLETGYLTRERYTQLLARSRSQIIGVTKAEDEAGRAYRTLAAQLDPAIRKTQELTRARQVLAEASRRGLIDQAEYSRMLQLAEKQAGGAGDGFGKLGGSIRGVRSALTGLLIGKVLEGGVEAVLELNKAFHFLGENGAEALGSLQQGISSLFRLDFAGAGRGLGQFLGAAIAQHQQNLREAMGAMTQAELQAERLRNLANINAKAGGIDFVARRAAALESIFGAPGEFEAKVAQVQNALAHLGTQTINLAQLNLLRERLQEILDLSLKTGRELPAALRSDIEALGVVSTAAEREREAAEQRAKQAAAENATRLRGLVAQYDPAGESVARLVDAQNLLAAALDRGGPLATRYAEALKKVKDELEGIRALRASNLQPERDLEPLPLKPRGVERFISDSDKEAVTYVRRELEAINAHATTWSNAQAAVARALELGKITAEEAERILKRIAEATGTIKINQDDVADSWEKVWEGFDKEFGASLEQAAKGFLAEMHKGFTDDLPEGVQGFAESLIGAADAWLVQILKNIAVAKAAGKTIGGADGGSGNVPWSSILGIGGTSGAGLSSGAIAAGAAVAAVLALNNYIDKRNAARSYDQAGRYGFGENEGASYAWFGRDTEKTRQIRDAITGFWQAFQQSTGSFIQGMGDLSIAIRHDQKRFKVTLDGVLIGTFKDVNQAILAAIKAQFKSTEYARALDPAITELVANYRGSDPKQLQDLIGMVQALVDSTSGLSQVDLEIRKLNTNSQLLASTLRQAGLSMETVQRLTAGSFLANARQQWQQISGYQRSPQEELAARQRSKEILLAELRLKKVELEARVAYLKSGAQLTKVEIERNRFRLKAEGEYLKADAGLMGAEGRLWGQYLDGRRTMVESVATLYGAELDVLAQYIAQLDAFINEVETGQIKIGGLGGGRGGLGRTNDLLERMRAALEDIRRLQRDLVLGELSPYTGRQKVEAARAEAERLRALYLRGGPGAVTAAEGLDEAVRTYLELFRSAYGTGGAYEFEVRDWNEFLSQMLRNGGIAPVSAIDEQATANADRIARTFMKDRRGKLHTRNEELEEQLAESQRTADRSEASLARMVDLLEDLNNSRGSASPATAPPPPPRMAKAG